MIAVPRAINSATQAAQAVPAPAWSSSQVVAAATLMAGSPQRKACHSQPPSLRTLTAGAARKLQSDETAEHQGAVGAAKAEIVLDRDIDLHLPRFVGAVIQITLGVGGEQVDGRRRDLMVGGQNREH